VKTLAFLMPEMGLSRIKKIVRKKICGVLTPKYGFIMELVHYDKDLLFDLKSQSCFYS
jgi:hypothetical protein